MTDTTRFSLIFRIRDHDDQVAWQQFVDIYGPMLYWFGRRKGLQDVDATDMAQEVFQQVSRAIDRFDYDPMIGKFRSWLFVIASRTISGMLKKQKRIPLATGDSTIAGLLNEIPAEEKDLWDTEYRKYLFDWACQHVKDEFSDSTWQAFAGTAIRQDNPEFVAKQVGISVGAVYIAKSRVIKRLRAKIATVDDTIDL